MSTQAQDIELGSLTLPPIISQPRPASGFTLPSLSSLGLATCTAPAQDAQEAQGLGLTPSLGAASAQEPAAGPAAPAAIPVTHLPDGTPLTADTLRARQFTGSRAARAFSQMPILRNLEFRDKDSLKCDAIGKSKLYGTACAGYNVGVVAQGPCDYMAK
ncbi:hypothetical protein DL98DRAFT_532229 [Cadophora sp. DSE1049]|nr:hypothetical protein DL98DRAFT_532229 [Cadophora sp. DSE1049]